MKRILFILALSVAAVSSAVAQGADVAANMDIDESGNIYVGGSSMRTDGNMAYFVVAYDADGVEQGIRYVLSSGEGPSIPAKLIADDGLGNIVITGTSPATTTGNDIVTVWFPQSEIVSVDAPGAAPLSFTLQQSYPNPVTQDGTALISYRLPNAADITLSIVDMSGKVIEVVEEGYKQAGKHTVSFSPQNLPSGTYFYRLTDASGSQVRKMAVIR